jgi:hypothetical protein
MSRVEAAAADRLPWLPDEPERQPVRRRGYATIGWAAAALAAVASAGFWIGTRSVEEQPNPSAHGSPTTTVRLPAPQVVGSPDVRMPSQPQVNPVPEPQVRPAPLREVRIGPPPAARTSSNERAPSPAEEKTDHAPPAAVVAAPAPELVMPSPWNPRVFAGASGRLVQIGAFGSVHQAKRGWWYMVRAYPAVAHLPAVVRPTRNSKGRVFYRFQVGTTSQAHSEVLCQRMQPIHFSCAVVGLPWKGKVER